MKKIFFLIPLLIALLGCLQLPQPLEDLSGFKDCGNNEQCIFESAKQGEKAFASFEQESQELPFGITTKIVSYGFEEGKSKIKLEIEEITPKEGDEGIASLAAAMLKGKEMVCLVSEQQMADIKSFDEEAMEENCTGSLIDLLKQFQSKE